MNIEIRVEGQERHARSVDANGIPCDRPVVSDDIVVFVGEKVVSRAMRERLGMDEPRTKGTATGSKTPPTRWGLPEDPPRGARLVG